MSNTDAPKASSSSGSNSHPQTLSSLSTTAAVSSSSSSSNNNNNNNNTNNEEKITRFSEGQDVYYKNNFEEKVKILKVHYDDDLEPFYTISIQGREKQTTDANLHLDHPLKVKLMEEISKLTHDQLPKVLEFVQNILNNNNDNGHGRPDNGHGIADQTTTMNGFAKLERNINIGNHGTDSAPSTATPPLPSQQQHTMPPKQGFAAQTMQQQHQLYQQQQMRMFMAQQQQAQRMQSNQAGFPPIQTHQPGNMQQPPPPPQQQQPYSMPPPQMVAAQQQQQQMKQPTGSQSMENPHHVHTMAHGQPAIPPQGMKPGQTMFSAPMYPPPLRQQTPQLPQGIAPPGPQTMTAGQPQAINGQQTVTAAPNQALPHAAVATPLQVGMPHMQSSGQMMPQTQPQGQWPPAGLQQIQPPGQMMPQTQWPPAQMQQMQPQHLPDQNPRPTVVSEGRQGLFAQQANQPEQTSSPSATPMTTTAGQSLYPQAPPPAASAATPSGLQMGGASSGFAPPDKGSHVPSPLPLSSSSLLQGGNNHNHKNTAMSMVSGEPSSPANHPVLQQQQQQPLTVYPHLSGSGGTGMTLLQQQQHWHQQNQQWQQQYQQWHQQQQQLYQQQQPAQQIVNPFDNLG